MSTPSTGQDAGLTTTGPADSLVAGGQFVLLRKDVVGDGVRLCATVAFENANDDHDLLVHLDLTSKGDTSFVIEGDELIGRRLIVDPGNGKLTEAAHDLAKQVVVARTLLSSGRPDEADVVVPPPDFPPIPGIDDVFAQYVTVDSLRPAWTAPDASSPSVRQLQPGELLSELERLGDWSRVSCNDGSVVYTDGRALVPFLKGERQ